MAAIGEPMLAVASIARPGGNVTGLSAFVTDLQAKRVELLKDVLPRLRRVATMMNMSNPVSPPQWKEIEAAAHSLGLEAHLLDVRKPAEIESAFDAAVAQQVEAIIVGIEAVTQMNAVAIAELAIKHRLATIFASKEFVEAGGLIAYGVSYPDLYRRAATYIDKIFKGARPADLPVEQPIKFELVINLKTARTIGLTFPQSIFLRADDVIE
jgi:putative ABC transport system substrate-binding protein